MWPSSGSFMETKLEAEMTALVCAIVCLGTAFLHGIVNDASSDTPQGGRRCQNGYMKLHPGLNCVGGGV